MKMKLSVFFVIVSMLLHLTACGAKARDGTVSSSSQTVTSAVESVDNADRSTDTNSSFSSHGIRQNTDIGESTDVTKDSVSRITSSKNESAASKASSLAAAPNKNESKAAASAATSKPTVSKATSSTAKTASKTESKKSSQTSSATAEATQTASKAVVSSRSEPPKTDSTTTEIETPREEKTESAQPADVSQTMIETTSSEVQIIEEPASSYPKEWVKQHPPVEYDKSTLDPEVAPYAYPYDLEAIRNEMIAYGESLGMHFDDRLDLEGTNWSMFTMSADFRDPWEGYDIDPAAFRDDCLGNISRFLKIYKETPPDWIYFNVLLLPDEEREGDFKVYVPHTIGDKFNFNEWYESIEDQL